MTYVEEKVREAMVWLDGIKPGWEGLVDLDIFDLSDPWRCVLGQVFAKEGARSIYAYSGYGYALHELRSRPGWAFGGDASMEGEWKLQIAKRQAQRAVTVIHVGPVDMTKPATSPRKFINIVKRVFAPPDDPVERQVVVSRRGAGSAVFHGDYLVTKHFVITN